MNYYDRDKTFSYKAFMIGLIGVVLVVLYSALTSRACYGQEDQDNHYKIGANVTFWIKPDSSDIITKNVIITIKDLMDYREYCYSDSTLWGYEFNWNEIGDTTALGRPLYKHSHYPSFPEFIEYMKIKYKIK